MVSLSQGTAASRGSPRILLIRLSAIGDVVHTMPAVAALRRAMPAAHVAYLVEDRAAGLLAGHPDLDEHLVFARHKFSGGGLFPGRALLGRDSVGGLVRALRERRFDFAVDFQGNLKSGFFLGVSGARVKIGLGPGHGREGNFLFSDRWVRPGNGVCLHRVRRNLALLEPLGVEANGVPGRLGSSPEDAARAEEFLKGIGGDGPRVAIHPATSAFGAFKRWAPDRYAALADRLAQERRAAILLTFGPGERPLADEVAGKMRSGAHLAPEPRGIGGLVEIFRLANLVIGGDTGPIQASAMLGTPTVAIFGPKDPRIYAPWGPRTRVVREPVPCGPCTLRFCDRVDCLKLVTVEKVFETAASLLDSAGEPQRF